MPVDYTLDREARWVIYVWSPPVELPDVVEALEQQARDGAWTFGVVHDMRAISVDDGGGVKPLLEAVRGLSEKHGRRGPVAIVASPPSVGSAQRYSILSDRIGQETQVFWDREEAFAWLRERLKAS